MTRGWGGMFIGLLFLLFIGLIVHLIVKSMKTTSLEFSNKKNTDLKVLKEHYDREEIKKEEYIEGRKDLEEDYIILYYTKSILKYLRKLGIIEKFYQFCLSINPELEKNKISKIRQNNKDKLIVFSLMILLIILLSYPFYRYSYGCQSIVIIFIIWRLAEILVYQLLIIFDSKKME